MPSVRKTKLAFKIMDKNEAMFALEIYAYILRKGESNPIRDRIERKLSIGETNEYDIRIAEFSQIYGHSYEETIKEIWKWQSYIVPEKRNYPIDEVYDNYNKYVAQFDKEPTKWSLQNDLLHISNGAWVFKGYVYEVKGLYSDDEIKLLILEDFDKERRYFEKLKIKFNEVQSEDIAYERPRIPESVRIEVWRRDGGKCARCGSREKLEYDHIVPISKGGSNTARNIELLCEKCNRSKSNNVV